MPAYPFLGTHVFTVYAMGLLNGRETGVLQVRRTKPLRAAVRSSKLTDTKQKQGIVAEDK